MKAMDYALTHCNVIDGNYEGKVQREMTILVRNGSIEKLGKTTEVDIPEHYQTLDLKGKYVMPGLINAHVHLFGSGKPMKAIGSRKQQALMLGFLKTKLGTCILKSMVEKNAMTALHSGTTTLRCVGDIYYSDVALRKKFEKRKDLITPRVLVSGLAITITGGHGDGTFGFQGDSPWECRKGVRRNLKEEVDLIKICVTGGVTDARKIGGAGELKMTLEEISAICEEAHKNGYMVAAHAESIEGVRLALKGGVDTIEHGSDMDDEIVQLFQRNPKTLRGYAALIPTLSPALTLALLDPAVKKMNSISKINARLVYENMIQGIKKGLKENICIGLGTDASCPFVTQYNTWKELEYLVKYAGITPQCAIYHATKANAKILGIDDATGCIEEGKSADIIVMEDNPLAEIKALSNIEMIMMRGKLIQKPKYKRIQSVDSQLEMFMQEHNGSISSKF